MADFAEPWGRGISNFDETDAWLVASIDFRDPEIFGQLVVQEWQSLVGQGFFDSQQWVQSSPLGCPISCQQRLSCYHLVFDAEREIVRDQSLAGTHRPPASPIQVGVDSVSCWD